MTLGTYKVYEIEGPEGYRVNRQPAMVEINSNSYKTMVDKLGKEYLYAECEYYNDVTYGKFTINKIGPELCKKDDESNSEESKAGKDEASNNSVTIENNGENEITTDSFNPFDYKDTLLTYMSLNTGNL